MMTVFRELIMFTLISFLSYASSMEYIEHYPGNSISDGGRMSTSGVGGVGVGGSSSSSMNNGVLDESFFARLERSSGTLCGEDLSKAVGNACEATGYNEPSYKRSDQSGYFIRKWLLNLESSTERLARVLEKHLRNYQERNASNFDRSRDIWLYQTANNGNEDSKENVVSGLQNGYFLRSQRSITKECCQRPCSIKTLRLYCNAPRGSKSE